MLCVVRRLLTIIMHVLFNVYTVKNIFATLLTWWLCWLIRLKLEIFRTRCRAIAASFWCSWSSVVVASKIILISSSFTVSLSSMLNQSSHKGTWSGLKPRFLCLISHVRLLLRVSSTRGFLARSGACVIFTPFLEVEFLNCGVNCVWLMVQLV